jgi:hypothetical protein
MRSASILTEAILTKSIDNDMSKSTDLISANQIHQQESMIIDLENESMSPPILVNSNHIKKNKRYPMYHPSYHLQSKIINVVQLNI